MRFYQILALLSLGGFVGYMRVYASQCRVLPRPYVIGAIGGLVSGADMTFSSESWLTIALWSVLGMYVGAIAGFAAGAIGNILGGVRLAISARHPRGKRTAS